MTATQERPSDEVEREIGRDRRRKEDQRLITGRTRWTDNLQLPGLLHLAMVRSPFAHATITSIDTSEAKKALNVVTVLTGGGDQPAVVTRDAATLTAAVAALAERADTVPVNAALTVRKTAIDRTEAKLYHLTHLQADAGKGAAQ